jgi:hypothetical protein
MARVVLYCIAIALIAGAVYAAISGAFLRSGRR